MEIIQCYYIGATHEGLYTDEKSIVRRNTENNRNIKRKNEGTMWQHTGEGY